MVGNDVVDLADPETRDGACHARFDERVFGALELATLRISAEPARLRWLLWAAKEASYKVARKDDPRTVFSPRAFEVCLTRRDRARVQHGARSFAVALELGDEYVHAVATAERGDAAGLRLAACARLPGRPAQPGAAARELALARVAAALGVPAGELAVAYAGRVPRLVTRAGAPLGDLSLSHHGRFVAFACELPRAAASRSAA